MKTNSRAKGADGEREVAKMFSHWFLGCRRSVGQIRFGHEQPDIIGGGIESEFFVEVKCHGRDTFKKKNFENERAKWWDKLIADQVKHQKLIGDEHSCMLALPVLVYRITGYRPKRGWMVGVHWESLPSLKPFIVANLKQYVMVVKWEDFAEYLDTIYDVT